jgi:hypothetical protein
VSVAAGISTADDDPDLAVANVPSATVSVLLNPAAAFVEVDAPRLTSAKQPRVP